MKDSNLRTLGWITVIVAAELFAFALLQKSIDSNSNAIFNTVVACILFGLAVPLAFKETLRDGNQIAAANLYWIILSAIGSILVGYLVFKQQLSRRELLSVPLLIAAVTAQMFL